MSNQLTDAEYNALEAELVAKEELGKFSSQWKLQEQITEARLISQLYKNIAVFGTKREEALSQAVLAEPCAALCIKIRDRVYDEYEFWLKQKPAISLEQAIQVLNDKQFKCERNNPDYIEEWIKDFESESATLTVYIAELKDSDAGRGERYYDCLDAFTVIAVAEKLLQEG